MCDRNDRSNEITQVVVVVKVKQLSAMDYNIGVMQN